ncbi:hypothetical protein ACXAAV_10735 [Vibrio coralliilyticus]
MANIDHPCFKQPGDASSKIWRYMDFTKFVSILENQNIFFCRADLFDDPFEGSIPKGNILHQEVLYSNIGIEHRQKAIEAMSSGRKQMKSKTYISCWHMNDKESAAMWKLYAMTHEAVAISTSYGKLRDLLSSKVYLGLVEYIDYETAVIPENNSFWPFMFKRLSFKHESEVRAVIQDIEGTYQSAGISESIEVNDLIDAIYVSPEAPQWYYELVKSITSKYGIRAPVMQSSLSEQPIY